jgi:hypothetical protein
MTVCLSIVAFSTTLAPAGIGKPPIPATLTVLPEPDEPDVGREAAECDAVGLGVALGLVIPAEHAASDSPAAPVTRATAAERYRFISFSLVSSSRYTAT